MPTVDKKYKQVTKKNYKEPKIPEGGARYIYDAWNNGVAGNKKKPSGGTNKKKK